MPFETLDRTTTRDGHELVLYRQNRDFYIYIDGQELMSSRTHGSERALAEIGCRRLGKKRNPHVLIGGLGLGFTLQAALEIAPRTTRLEVVELFDRVVHWHRKSLGELAMPIDHERVKVTVGDVVDVIATAAKDPYDAILLDVDNGPSALCVDGNHRLYADGGLAAIRAALSPRGVLTVWSTNRDRGFVRRLTRAGFAASEEPVRAHAGKGPRHTIFVAEVRGG
ncbi:MAG: spermidine synthase [Acidobacteriota bacterium]|nr:spermidine synthase [Acidobacteriota bacterium]